jgi:hypothetical protein
LKNSRRLLIGKTIAKEKIMISKHIFRSALFLFLMIIVWPTATPCAALNPYNVSLSAVIDASGNDANNDKKWDTIRFDSLSLLAYNAQPDGYNWRAAIEFDVSSIPSSADILSAVFRIRYNGANGMPAETLQFHSYAGDGLITFSDFEVSNQIGPLYNAFGPGSGKSFYEVPATSFVQSLLADHESYAGFMVMNRAWNQTAFYSRLGGPSYEPRLDITYAIPEPAVWSLLLSALGLLGIGRALRAASLFNFLKVAVFCLCLMLLAAPTFSAPLPWSDVSVVELGADGCDFDYDPLRELIYVSIPSQNEIVYISKNTKNIVHRQFVGSKPMGLDYAPLADRVFVALNQAAAVAEVNPDGNLVSEIVVGGSPGLGSSLAYDVVEGKANQIFVSANPGSGGFSYIAKIDLNDGNAVSTVASNRIIRASPIFQETVAGDFLYIGEGFSPNSLYKLNLDLADAPIVLEDQHGTVSGTNYIDINPAGTRLYLSSGQVLRSDSFLQAGLIGSGIPRLNETGDTAYVIKTSPSTIGGLKSYSTSTFLETGSYDLPMALPEGVKQFDLLPHDSGLVILSGNKLIIAVPEPPLSVLALCALLGMTLYWRKHYRAIFSCCVAMALTASLEFVSTAQAEFVNGIERFTGTVLDNSTWQMRYGLSQISQNDALFINTFSGSMASYDTKQIRVGVAQAVEAQVAISDVRENYSNMTRLALTTKDNQNPNLDSHALYAALERAPNSSLMDIIAFRVNAGSGVGYYMAHNISGWYGTSYIVRIERLSSTQAKFMAFDADHAQLGTTITWDLSGFPDDLYISLYSQVTNARFDYVMITPEPAAWSLLLSALGLLGIGRAFRPVNHFIDEMMKAKDARK